jgi:hypothetical protein
VPKLSFALEWKDTPIVRLPIESARNARDWSKLTRATPRISCEGSARAPCKPVALSFIGTIAYIYLPFLHAQAPDIDFTRHFLEGPNPYCSIHCSATTAEFYDQHGELVYPMYQGSDPSARLLSCTAFMNHNREVFTPVSPSARKRPSKASTPT